jgi:hypothetical protein
MKKLLLRHIAYVLEKFFDCEVYYFTGKYNKLDQKIYNKLKL